MKQETMFYIALGTVVDEIEKSDAYASFVDLAETTDERNRYRRRALKTRHNTLLVLIVKSIAW